MEEREAKRICLERRAGFSRAKEDLISKLPDSLITQILLYLPIKKAVRTCVLSKRWESIWLSIPWLDLDSEEFPNYKAFVIFMDRFVDFSREQKSCLHKLKLSIQKIWSDQYRITRWIDFVATRKLQHLDVECLFVKRECFEVMPLSLYICETLITLRLHRIYLDSFESVSLPRLKTMHLELNVYDNDAGLESLISSCPVLEDLSIVRSVDYNDNVNVLRVHSQTLTSLSVEFDLGEWGLGLFCFGQRDLGLWIDAPRLKYLNFKHELSDSKTVSNLNSLVKVNFVGSFRISDGGRLSKQQMARNFFIGISKVRDLNISAHILELINCYLKVEPLPQFFNLSYLEAEFCSSDVKILESLQTLLESCPNLKSIVLDLTDSTTVDTSQTRVPFVPQCLLSSLEFVDIRGKFMAEPVAVELARYFVENSVILKKIVMRLGYFMPGEEDSVALKDLLATPRRSSTCQIEVCEPLNFFDYVDFF
ncbi:FBD-associated F-box protein At5g22730 [Arabidopsis lyrata subsp. lyrata]|uniref:FBD-associated F-box protein At5g22730 n=1 Tax=Arabidopsis lyrata subsp. lyrata TaxID=81972 RepID=UPI000A29AA14|nr:FBD-associated F-box protein At5g22730 [Arabidopsis lyrata subsp. lyrata]|eukprot:XP_020879003.1 FBD-associated F-box protein At5g22730 [Arabidopsis lyrata subsp. lyrata]